MHASVDVFLTHKDGGVAADYEDAAVFRPSAPDDAEVSIDDISVAVADGASESLLAGRWARLLVDEFAEAEPLLDGGWFAETAAQAATRWAGVYGAYVEERRDRGKPIAWYEEPGLARGAYATLLVAHFSESGTWSAAALGDSCLFHVREERLLAAFPLDTAAAFGTHPHLLNSRNVDEELITAKTLLFNGRWEHEDAFFLCTDALAAWFLLESEAGREPWATLRDLGTDAIPGPFEEWVAGERTVGRMRNDDVTLVRVHMW
jgi:hypothetical protein